MTRFQSELSGALGAYWTKNAQEQIAKMQARADNGEIRVDENGAAFWTVNNRAIPSDAAEVLSYTTFTFDLKATEFARDAQTAISMARYMKASHEPTAEEKAEMAATFGKGTTVVDCISGARYRI